MLTYTCNHHQTPLNSYYEFTHVTKVLWINVTLSLPVLKTIPNTDIEREKVVSGQYPPGQYPPDNIPPDNIPPGQNPPGQYPPVPISPRTISPRMISLVKHVLVKIFLFNSSVLNYPKTCVGKLLFYFFVNSSVLNYPKSCAGKKKIAVF